MFPMGTSVSVEGHLKFEDVDGSEKPCCLCGEPVWFRAKLAVFYALKQKCLQSVGPVCNACVEVYHGSVPMHNITG